MVKEMERKMSRLRDEIKEIEQKIRLLSKAAASVEKTSEE